MASQVSVLFTGYFSIDRERPIPRRDFVFKCFDTFALLAYVFSFILVSRYIRGQSSWKILFNAFISGALGHFLSKASGYSEVSRESGAGIMVRRDEEKQVSPVHENADWHEVNDPGSQ